MSITLSIARYTCPTSRLVKTRTANMARNSSHTNLQITLKYGFNYKQ